MTRPRNGENQDVRGIKALAAWATLIGFLIIVPVLVIIISGSGTSAPTQDQELNARVLSLETEVNRLKEQVSSLDAKINRLAAGPAATPTVASTATPTYHLNPVPDGIVLVVQVERGNVRAGPGTNHPVIGSVKEGDIIDKTFGRHNSGWYRFCCTDGNKPGWVAGSLVVERRAENPVSIIGSQETRPAPTPQIILRPTPFQVVFAPRLPVTSDSSDHCLNQLRKGQYQKAVDCYDGKIGLFSREPTHYLNRGVAKSMLGQFEAAIQDYDQVIKLDPAEACAFRNRGISRNNIGQIQAAYTDFTEAIRIRPDYDEAYTSRGLLLLQDFKQFQSAVTDFDKAISLKGSRLTGSAPQLCSPTPERNPTPGPSPTPHPCPNNCYVDDESRYILTYLGRAHAHYYLENRQQSLTDSELALALARKYRDRTSEASALNLINALR